jgi:TPR repeat protein
MPCGNVLLISGINLAKLLIVTKEAFTYRLPKECDGGTGTKMLDRLMNDEELRSRDPDLAKLDQAQALVPTDFSTARAMFEELADCGSVLAMSHLAFALVQSGDIQEAKRWYRNAYEKGSSTGLYSLAMIENRQGFVRKAEILWEQGASEDDGPSVFRLAALYLNSEDKIQRAQSRALLEKAHGLGQLRATILLAQRLTSGKYGIQNIPKGIVLFLRGAVSAYRVAQRDPGDRRLW